MSLLDLRPFRQDRKHFTHIIVEKTKLNGTILCYAAARADKAQTESPFFDRVIGCAKKLLSIYDYEKVIESKCHYYMVNPDGSELKYELNVLQGRVSLLYWLYTGVLL